MNFLGYMEVFKPILLAGLENHREFQVRCSALNKLSFLIQHVLQVCSAAVGVVGDLCRALNVNMTPYCDDIMARLLNNLAVC